MFGRCVVINLERRPERLASFRSRVPHDWPFATIQRAPAFDGAALQPPEWYGFAERRRLQGAWGCFQSHLAVYRAALDDGLDSVLIFEDDAVFRDDFTRMASEFCDAIPSDWEAVYFGGQHLHPDTHPPLRVSEHVLLGREVNRTHAYAMRRPFLEHVVERLSQPWPRQSPYNYYNFDFQLGLMHLREHRRVYCPSFTIDQWLCGQAAGTSDVAPDVKFHSTLWWREFQIGPAEREAVPC